MESPLYGAAMSVSTNTQPSLADPGSLARKLRSSVRTGRRLHLAAPEIAVLLTDEIYSVICRLEAEEMRIACARGADNDNRLGIIGCGSDLTAARGASAGSNAAEMDAMSRGARLRLSEALSEVDRPRKL
jgi:hypothetical protein